MINLRIDVGVAERRKLCFRCGEIKKPAKADMDPSSAL
jgi:hypothetical protein